MGRKDIVPYGLYSVHGFISPFFAQQCGFSEDDLELFWSALKGMFEIDHSAARGEMVARRLVVFQHQSKLGHAPSHELFERINVERANTERPPRTYQDYSVSIDDSDLPSGVEIKVLI